MYLLLDSDANTRPGFMSGGVFLLERATHTTSMPTHTTMMVADTGTIMFRSIHSGKPGKLPVFVSALLTFPPNGGARVPEISQTYL